MKCYPFLVMMLTVLSISLSAQNNCSNPVVISTLPYSSGSLSTCGTVNDYASGSYCSSSNYGGGEDYVFSYIAANSGAHAVTIAGGIAGTDIWKIVSFHTACPPTAGNCVGGVTTGSSNTGSGSVNLTSGIQYYIFVDTWPAPNCATFTLDIAPPPPPPANDNCAGAIDLTVNSNLSCASTTSGTTVGATQSPDATPTCAASGIDDDVWYSFVCTQVTQQVKITAASNTCAIAVYNGTCGSLSQISGACATTSSGTATLNFTGLTVGNTYYIRVYTTASSATNATFTMCVGTPPPPPANDECVNAIAFPTITTDQSCANVTANTANATQSIVGCAGTADDDVWYSFVCPTGYTSLLFSNTTVSGETDRVTQFYSGSCGSLTSILCSDPESGTVTGLVGGQTYYMRIYSYFSSVATQVTVCLKTPPPPPANDNCAGAIDLTVNSNLSCASTTSGTTVGATQSPDAAPTCAASGIDDDVWYSFVCTQVTQQVKITAASNTCAIAVYNGTCGSLAQISGACATTSSGTATLNFTGLTVGNTYYIRVYTTASSATNATFIMCVGTPPPPPANDECVNAIAFPTIPTDQSCANVTANTANATQSIVGCAGTADDDVWYSFVCPTGYTSLLFSNTTVSGETDRVTQFYSGSCGSLTSILCSDPESGTVTGLVGGQTYYMRIYSYFSSVATQVTVCLKTPPPPPANDNCAGAIDLTVNSNLSCASTTSGTTVGATQSPDAAPTCAASGIDDDVWYSFVCTQVTQQVKITAASNTCAIAVYNGTCGSLAQISGACATTSSGTATLNFTGLTVGNTYYIRVYTTASSATNATFTMCVGTPPPPPANDECVNAIAFPTIPTDQSCANVTANTANATQSIVGCAGTADDDVWYSFVCPTGYTSLLFSNTTVSGETDRVTQFYSGSCGSLTSILCSDPESGTVTGLVGGQTYYMRIYSYFSSVATQVTVCLKTPPPPPKTWVGGTGDWNTGSNWSPAGTPTCTDSVLVTNGVINLNGASGACRGLNQTGGTLNLNSGTLAIGICSATDGGNRYLVQSGGTLNFSGATVTLNGGFTQTAGTTNISAGSFVIDPNGGSGVYGVSNSCNIAGIFTMSGGTLNLADASSTSGNVLYYNNSSNANFSGGTVVIGGGGSTNVMNINTYVGSGRLAFYNLEINSGPNNTYVNSSSWSFGVLNDLIISSGELRASLGLYVNGNLSNAGTLTTTSTLYLANFVSGSTTSSANNQVVSGSGVYRNSTTKTAEFNALVINNAGSVGVTLDILDPSVGAGFTLTAGKVFGASGGQFTIWAKNSYAYTSGWIVGKFKRTISSSGAATFHVGTSTTSYPATVTFSSNPAGSLTTSFESGAPGSSGLPLTEASGTNPYLGADSLWAGGIWRLTTADIGSTSYSFAATATGAPVNGNTANVRVIKRADSGSGWNNPGTHIAGSGVIFSRSGLSGFSEFGIVRGSLQPLPLEFLSVKAVAFRGYNDIIWTTANEKNTAWHEILRSPTGSEDYESIGKVPALQNSQTSFLYKFTDANPLLKAYYRIKTIDLDGSETMSNVVSATQKGSELLQVNLFPNPTSSVLNFEISSESSVQLLILVFDAVGKLVLTKEIDPISGSTSASIDTSRFPPGTYQVQISDTFKTVTKRFVKE